MGKFLQSRTVECGYDLDNMGPLAHLVLRTLSGKLCAPEMGDSVVLARRRRVMKEKRENG